MRMYDVMLFLFIFNYVLGMLVLTDIGISDNEKLSRIDQAGDNKILDQETVESYAAGTAEKVNQANEGIIANLNYLVESVKLIILALPTMIGAFLGATIMFPVMLYMIHVPTVLIPVLTAIVWLIYFVGISQLVSGRSFKEGA